MCAHVSVCTCVCMCRGSKAQGTAPGAAPGRVPWQGGGEDARKQEREVLVVRGGYLLGQGARGVMEGVEVAPPPGGGLEQVEGGARRLHLTPDL